MYIHTIYPQQGKLINNVPRGNYNVQFIVNNGSGLYFFGANELSTYTSSSPAVIYGVELDAVSNQIVIDF